MSRQLAIVGNNGEILYATPAAMRLFEAKSLGDLQRALFAGDGPNARRLRHLASTLPIGGPPRLERMRFSDGRRSTSINLLCARVSARNGGTALALSMSENRELLAGQNAPPAAEPLRARPRSAGGFPGPSLGAVADPVGRAPQHSIDAVHNPSIDGHPFGRPMDRVARAQRAAQNCKSRFLWTLDLNGRFGVTDPVLIAALGAAAPQSGETLEGLRLRAQIKHADELASLIEKRETFSDFALVWRGSGEDRGLRVTLSATPTFDSRRDFAGYRGFGLLHEPIAFAREPDNADDHSDLVQSHRVPCLVPSAGSGIPLAIELSTPILDQPSLAPPGEVATPYPKGSAKEEGDASPIALAQDETHAAPSFRRDDEADGSETVPASPERSAAETAQSGAPHERTAEIYFLRQAAAAPSRVIPIRPVAVDALAARELAQAAGDSVELSLGERDAFREIARALVGRPQASRQDGEIEPVAPVAEAALSEAFRSPLSQSPLPEGERQKVAETALRNASGILDRLPVGVLVARDARALYLNRTLLDLLGYRDLGHFELSEGLATMFRGHDPQSVSVEDHSALSIVKSDGQAIAVEGHAQVVPWDGAPATLFSLRRSTESEIDEKLRQPRREKPTRSDWPTIFRRCSTARPTAQSFSTSPAASCPSTGRLSGCSATMDAKSWARAC